MEPLGGCTHEGGPAWEFDVPASVEANIHYYISTTTTLFQEGLIMSQLRRFRQEKDLFFSSPYFQQSSMESPLPTPNSL